MLPRGFTFDYVSRLKGDIQDWRKRGWITSEGAQAILAEVAKKDASWPLSATLISFAVILLGLGVLLFVASNWDEMSRAFRLGLLISASVLAYSVSAGSFKYHKGGSALAAFLGLTIFAGTLAFLSQSFHMTRHDESLVLGFALVALMGALLLGSRLYWISAFVAFGIWTTMEVGSFYQVLASDLYLHVDPGLYPHVDPESEASVPFIPLHLESLFAAIAVTWCALRLEWRFALHLCGVAVMLWCVVVASIFIWNWQPDFRILLSLTFMMFSLVLATVSGLWRQPALIECRGALVSYLSVVLFAVVMSQQFLSYSLAKLSLGPFVANPKFEAIASQLSFGIGDLILLAFSGLMLLIWLSTRSQIHRIDMYCLFIFLALIALTAGVMRATGQLPSVWLSASIIIGYATWLADFGRRTESVVARSIAYLGFIVELGFIHYTFIEGRLLDTSVVFLLGGFVLLAIAVGVIAFERLNPKSGEA